MLGLFHKKPFIPYIHILFPHLMFQSNKLKKNADQAISDNTECLFSVIILTGGGFFQPF